MPMAVEADWAETSCPTLALLEALAEAGWSHGPPPQPHTADSPRFFTVTDPVRQKAYLRCLCGLPVLMGERGHDALPVGQLSLYYECVLNAARPSDVPLGKSGKEYSAMLRRTPVVSQEEEGSSLAEARRLAGYSSSEDAVFAPKAKAPRRQTPRRTPAAGSSSAKDTWQSLLLNRSSSLRAEASGSDSRSAGTLPTDISSNNSEHVAAALPQLPASDA